MAQIIGRETRPDEHKRAPRESEPAVFWTVFAVAGLAISLVGWTDLALLWYPLGFGRPDWEFGVVSAHFDAMPLATVGFVMLMSGALAASRWRVARLLSAAAGLVALFLVCVFVVYLLDIPLALDAAGARAHSAMMRSIAKTSAFAVIYMTLYSWLGWYVWRGTRR